MPEQPDVYVPCANLRNCDLSGMDLSGVNLEFADLEGANLSRANLQGAILYGASLAGANLDSADLRSANLRDTNLLRANLTNVVVDSRTDFTGALSDKSKKPSFDYEIVPEELGFGELPMRRVGFSLSQILAHLIPLWARILRFNIRFRLRRLRK